MRNQTDEREIQERIKYLKEDFCGTAMEGTDIEWLLGLPRYKDDLPTDVEEIRKQIEDKGSEIR